MSERSNASIFKFFSGLFVGLLGGFAAGILLADKPGRELRRDIELSSSEVVHHLREKLGDIKEEAGAKISEFKGFTDEKFRNSAIDIQDKVTKLGEQLDQLTKASKNGTAQKEGSRK